MEDARQNQGSAKTKRPIFRRNWIHREYLFDVVWEREGALVTDGITVRRCEFHRDVDALLDLFGVVFGQRIDRLVWEWKHRLHPAR